MFIDTIRQVYVPTPNREYNRIEYHLFHLPVQFMDTYTEHIYGYFIK
jgi:hypothetical protein